MLFFLGTLAMYDYFFYISQKLSSCSQTAPARCDVSCTGTLLAAAQGCLQHDLYVLLQVSGFNRRKHNVQGTQQHGRGLVTEEKEL